MHLTIAASSIGDDAEAMVRGGGSVSLSARRGGSVDCSLKKSVDRKERALGKKEIKKKKLSGHPK